MTNSFFQYIQNNITTLATIFFFIFFCYVVYSVFKKGQEDKFNKYSNIPLNDEPDNKNPVQTNDKSEANSITKEKQKIDK